ncbi:hypothetical protein C8R47DRAFT_1069263 [Mycena vitilis]|nr:hypothetical protein C8R47DRAFT_1069263 [Mycena vitilis]
MPATFCGAGWTLATARRECVNTPAPLKPPSAALKEAQCSLPLRLPWPASHEHLTNSRSSSQLAPPARALSSRCLHEGPEVRRPRSSRASCRRPRCTPPLRNANHLAVRLRSWTARRRAGPKYGPTVGLMATSIRRTRCGAGNTKIEIQEEEDNDEEVPKPHAPGREEDWQCVKNCGGAPNIHGQTIHPALGLCVNADFVPLPGARLARIQAHWKGDKFLIVDEKSMLGPLLEHPSLSIDGSTFYHLFDKSYRLQVLHRQQGESEDQLAFKSVLKHASQGGLYGRLDVSHEAFRDELARNGSQVVWRRRLPVYHTPPGLINALVAIVEDVVWPLGSSSSGPPSGDPVSLVQRIRAHSLADRGSTWLSGGRACGLSQGARRQEHVPHTTSPSTGMGRHCPQVSRLDVDESEAGSRSEGVCYG